MWSRNKKHTKLWAKRTCLATLKFSIFWKPIRKWITKWGVSTLRSMLLMIMDMWIIPSWSYWMWLTSIEKDWNLSRRRSCSRRKRNSFTCSNPKPCSKCLFLFSSLLDLSLWAALFTQARSLESLQIGIGSTSSSLFWVPSPSLSGLLVFSESSTWDLCYTWSYLFGYVQLWRLASCSLIEW